MAIFNNIKYELIYDEDMGGCVKGGDIDTWEPEIWNELVNNFKINTMYDVGCGEGWSTKYFVDCGIDCVGIEGSKKVINGSPHKNHIIQHDYKQGPCPGLHNVCAIWSCEFVEHVEEKYMNNYLDTFKKGKYVFMTYSEPIWSDGGHHHVNCQSQEYWNLKLKSIGFKWLEEYSLALRDKCKAKWIKPTLSIYKKL